MKEYIAPEFVVSALEVEDVTNDDFVVDPDGDNEIPWQPGWMSKIENM